MRRRLVAAVATGVVLAAGLLPSSAAAATTVHWSENSWQSGSPSRLVDEDDASVSVCVQPGATDSVVVMAGTCGHWVPQVQLSAPAGGSFAPGQTYTASSASQQTSVVLPLGQAPCLYEAYSSSVSILDVGRDANGALTSVAADYSLQCTVNGRVVQTAVGALRWNSTVPYAVGGLDSLAYVAPAPLPTNLTESVVLPVTLTGSASRQVAGISVGTASRDVSVTSTTCTGTSVSASTPCSVTVSVDATGSPSDTTAVADLSLAVTGGQSIDVDVHIALRQPLQAPIVAPFPTSSGVALSLSVGGAPPPPGDTATVQRRVHGGTAWTTLVTGFPAPPSGPMVYADSTVAPGTTYDYAVIWVSAGVPSYQSSVTIVTIAAATSTPVPTTRTRIAGWIAAPASAPVYTSADTALGDTESVSRDGLRTSVELVSAGPPTVSLSFHIGPVPGPGSYDGSSVPFGFTAVLDGTECGATTGDVLEVRQVLYAVDGTLAALDASARLACGGHPLVLEMRFQAGDGLATPYADPPVVSELADPGADAASVTVNVTNPGPDAAAMGDPTVTGAGAASWTVSGCAAGPLAVGATCQATAVFHGTAPTDPGFATLSFPVTAGTTQQTDLVVALDGRTTDVPGVPTAVHATTDPGHDYVDWSPPVDDGGRPVTSYVIQRRTPDTLSWRTVGSVPADAVLGGTLGYRFVDPLSPVPGVSLRVSAVNERGEGLPSDAGIAYPDASPAVMSGSSTEMSGGLPWGLYEGQPWGLPAPLALEVDGHEHRSATATPDGRAVVYSRAGTAGAGQTDFDLYRLPLAPGAVAVRLTSSPGAELDAETSPDGTLIAYTHEDIAASGALVNPDVCLVAATGGAPIACLAGLSHPSWLSSTALLARDDRTPGAALVAVPASASGFGWPAPLAGTAGAGDPTVSPDGQRVAYVTTGRSGMVYDTSCGCSQTAVLPAGSIFRSAAWVDDTTIAWWVDDAFVGAMLPAQFASGSGAVAAEVSGFPATTTRIPVIGQVTPSLVKPGDRLAVPVSDAGLPKGGLRVLCAVDGGPATSCLDGFDTTGTPSGHHTLLVTALDPGGGTSSATVPFTVDGTPPVPSSADLAEESFAPSTPALLYGSDLLSGVRSFDYLVTDTALGSRSTTARPSGSVLAVPTSQTATVPVPLGPARRTCARARAVDAVGNVGAWGVDSCVITPFDDRNLVASRGWTRSRASGAYRGTVSTTRTRGATLVAPVPLAAHLVTVAAVVGPGYGRVRVSVGRWVLGTLSLSSRTKAVRQFRIILPASHTGRVVLTSLSSGPVLVDALLVR